MGDLAPLPRVLSRVFSVFAEPLPLSILTPRVQRPLRVPPQRRSIFFCYIFDDSVFSHVLYSS